MKTCKYPDKECKDRYFSNRNNYTTPICRLDEWKKKKGVCPYNKEIMSRAYNPIIKKKLDKQQTKLEV